MSQGETRPRDPAPAHDGWTRRFTAIGARLSEAVELYRRLGFEIRLEPAAPGSEEVADTDTDTGTGTGTGTDTDATTAGCEQCFVMSLARIIYTRPLIARTNEEAAQR